MLRLLRAPALHFAVAGMVLFLAGRAIFPSASGDDEVASRRIVIDAARIRSLRHNYSLANKVVPDEADTRALVESAVIEEILFRESVARGFQNADRAVSYRLVQKMRFLGEDRGEDAATLYHKALGMGLHKADPVVRRILTEKLRIMVGRAAPPPTEQELADWYSSHPGKYAQPSRITLRHAFFSLSRRGADAAHAAAIEEAASLAADSTRVPAGDAFVMGPRLAGQSAQDLVKFFGPAFAEEALGTPEGRWQGPIESTFGWHVIFVEKRFDERVPALDEVRSQVEKAFMAEQREDRVVEFLERVRPSYTVSIDEAALKEDFRG